MAKTSSANTTLNNDTKELKRQAKQEAKMMLHVEETKKDVGKAEQKAQKAHQLLKKRTAYLHSLEEKLTQLRSSEHNGTPLHTEEQPLE